MIFVGWGLVAAEASSVYYLTFLAFWAALKDRREAVWNKVCFWAFAGLKVVVVNTPQHAMPGSMETTAAEACGHLRNRASGGLCRGHWEILCEHVTGGWCSTWVCGEEASVKCRPRYSWTSHIFIHEREMETFGCISNNTIYSSLIPKPKNMVSERSETKEKNPRQRDYSEWTNFIYFIQIWNNRGILIWVFGIVFNIIINQSHIGFIFKKSLHISGVIYLKFLAFGNQKKERFSICPQEQRNTSHSVQTDRLSTASRRTGNQKHGKHSSPGWETWNWKKAYSSSDGSK